MRSTNSLQFALLGIFLLTSAAQAVTPVRLVTENAALLVWEDGANVDVALRIKNDGVAPARNVRIDSVTLRGGIARALDPLPRALGDLEPEVDTVLNLRLTVPHLDGTHYLLTINGRYTYAGQDYGFSLNRHLEPGRTTAGSVSTHDGITVSTYDGISVNQHSDAARYPPPPPPSSEEPNTEIRNLIPQDPHESFAPTSTPPVVADTNSADVQTQVNVDTRQLKYLFALDAGINATKRPRAYVRIDTLRLNPRPSEARSSLDIYVPLAEYDIWHPDDAHAMEALETFKNVSFPSIGIALAVVGGAMGYPKFPVDFKDDSGVYQVTNSNATQVSRFGDYMRACNIFGTPLFATGVHDGLQNVPGSSCATASCRTLMRYVQVGRRAVVVGLR